MRAEANDFVTSHRRRNDMSPFFIVPPAVKLHKKQDPATAAQKKESRRHVPLFLQYDGGFLSMEPYPPSDTPGRRINIRPR